MRDLADRLVAVDVEGQIRHVLAEDVESLLAAEPSSAVRLLPGHDQWVMGPGTSEEHVVPPDLRTAVTRKANLVTVGGVVRGTWASRGDDLVVTSPADSPLAADQLATEAGRLAVILDRPLHLVLRNA